MGYTNAILKGFAQVGIHGAQESFFFCSRCPTNELLLSESPAHKGTFGNQTVKDVDEKKHAQSGPK
jgi:hypothetical protein